MTGKPAGSNSVSPRPHDQDDHHSVNTRIAAAAFAAAAIAAGGFPLIGSVASLCTGVAGFAAFALMLGGKVPVFLNPATRLLSGIIIVYVIAGFAGYALHPEDEANLQQAAMRGTFLWFLPLASLFAVLPAGKLLEAVATGAAAGAMATLAYVGFELLVVGHQRAWGGAGNPGPFATVMTVQFSLCILALFRDSSRTRWLFAAGAIAAVLCILASGMRTVLPVLLLVPAFEAFDPWRRKTRAGSFGAAKRRRRIWFVLVLAFAALAVAASGRVWDLQHEFAMTMQGKIAGNSLGHRMAIWQFAADRLPQNWLAGMGQDAAVSDLKAYTHAHFGYALGKTHLHNIALTALFRGGIIDFAATMLMLFSPLLVLVRHRACNSEGMHFLVYLWLVYFLMAMTNLAFGHDVLDHHFIAMLAAASAIAYRPLQEKDAGELVSHE